jgi:uncharacterized protein YutE (UPF0331/DUF86 family)
VADDIVLNKSEIIENSLRRIREEYGGKSERLRLDQTRQDAILLNLERACQAAIDLGMHLVRRGKLGLPKESRDAFVLLHSAGLIDDDLLKKMSGLVGFRNTAIHNYKKLDLDIVEAILNKHLEDFRILVRIALQAKPGS